MKKLLTTQELLEHMKAKGIQFNIVGEEEAKKFLSNNNYYMKLSSYRYNYDKIESGKNQGKYKNLEFAYLQELSTIDMELRYKIFSMCLDLEHSIKVKFLREIENNVQENGYDIIRKYITKYPDVLKKIFGHKSSEYCRELIEKYYPYFPAWVFVELITFGELTKLCAFYNDMYNCRFVDTELLNSVRDLRNASAHSNCLINKLRKNTNKSVKAVSKVNSYISRIGNIGATSRINKLSNQFIYDFVVLLIAYDENVESQGMKNYQYNDLKNFFENRVGRHTEYFDKNMIISSAFDFLKKVVDNL